MYRSLKKDEIIVLDDDDDFGNDFNYINNRSNELTWKSKKKRVFVSKNKLRIKLSKKDSFESAVQFNEVIELSSDSDAECEILEKNPLLEHAAQEKLIVDDEVSVVGTTGEIACRDFPHARSNCANFPFDRTSHRAFCKMCYCYVCDIIAPCSKWGTGNNKNDHCNASDKTIFWRNKRKEVKMNSSANGQSFIDTALSRFVFSFSNSVGGVSLSLQCSSSTSSSTCSPVYPSAPLSSPLVTMSSCSSSLLSSPVSVFPLPVSVSPLPSTSLTLSSWTLAAPSAVSVSSLSTVALSSFSAAISSSSFLSSSSSSSSSPFSSSSISSFSSSFPSSSALSPSSTSTLSTNNIPFLPSSIPALFSNQHLASPLSNLTSMESNSEKYSTTHKTSSVNEIFSFVQDYNNNENCSYSSDDLDKNLKDSIFLSHDSLRDKLFPSLFRTSASNHQYALQPDSVEISSQKESTAGQLYNRYGYNLSKQA